MDWSQVLYAGIGGGLGGGGGTLIAHTINNTLVKNKKYHSGIIATFAAGLAVFGINYATSLYKDMALPRITTSVENQLLASSPLYPEMKKYEPEYFNKIIQHVDESARGNMSEEDMINSSREILVGLITKKLKYADTDTLTVTIEMARQSYLEYKISAPYLCTQLLNQRGLGDVTKVSSKESLKLEQKYMLQVIRLPYVKQQTMNKELAQQTQQNMTEKMGEFMKPGEDTDPPKSANVETLKRVCDIGVKDMNLILELPDKERGNYLRFALGL